jgi:hypothetical protein
VAIDETPVAPVSLYFPPNAGTWETVTPASVGWNEAALPAFRDFLISSDTRALIVLKDGKIVLEEYNGKQIDHGCMVLFCGEVDFYEVHVQILYDFLTAQKNNRSGNKRFRGSNTLAG